MRGTRLFGATMKLTLKFVYNNSVLEQLTYTGEYIPLHIPNIGDTVFIKNLTYFIFTRVYTFSTVEQIINYQLSTSGV